MNCQTIEMEAGAAVVSTDGQHGQVSGTDCERGTFRVRWSAGSGSTHFQGDGSALAARLPGVDMEEAR